MDSKELDKQWLDMFYEDVVVADTAIARKLYPKYEKLENGELKIGTKKREFRSGNALALLQSQHLQRHGKSAAARMQILEQMLQYGLIGPNKPSEASEDGNE